MLRILGLNKTTLLDYPGHLACTIFLAGCNMRCPFCQNTGLVLSPYSGKELTETEVLHFLDKRRALLEGVCITGGEPTLSPELPAFVRRIKELGYKVKLDTNGCKPQVIQSLASRNLIDYAAMDIKADPDHYIAASGTRNIDLDAVKESVRFLKDGSLPYEFRTTIVKEIHTHEQMHTIGKWLQNASAYFLQSFQDSGDILVPGLTAHSNETLLEFLDIVRLYIPKADLRGVYL